MKHSDIISYTVFLSIPISLMITPFFFYSNLEFKNLVEIFQYKFWGYFLTFPFFFLFLKFRYQKLGYHGLILIQLEILLHFIYTMVVLFYCNAIQNYIPVYTFLIFLFVYYIFKIVILVVLKKIDL